MENLLGIVKCFSDHIISSRLLDILVLKILDIYFFMWYREYPYPCNKVLLNSDSWVNSKGKTFYKTVKLS